MNRSQAVKKLRHSFLSSVTPSDPILRNAESALARREESFDLAAQRGGRAAA